jgi:PAS domain S-box-containing protein
MSVSQFTQQVESFRNSLNTLEQQISGLPKTQTQSDQIFYTFLALRTSLESLTNDTTSVLSEEKFFTGKHELRALFHEALDAILIANDTGRYVDANPAACELLGLSREEILTRSVSDIKDPNIDFSQVWQSFLEQGKVKGEFRILRPDGTVRETEYTAVANFVPHRHLSILRDITERKRLESDRNQIEADLLQKQRLIEQITEAIPAILYVYDLCERRNIYANRQLPEILGYSTETIQTRGTEFVQTLIHPEDKLIVAGIFQQLATTKDGEVVEAEYRIRHANGEWCWLHIWNVVLTRNADDSPQQVLGVATNITRIKQTEEELRQSQAKYRTLNEELEQRVAQRTAELTREIEERQRLEEELRASQQKYKTLFDILPVGIAITDPDGKVLEVNPASEEIFGISADEHCQRRYDSPKWQVIRPDGSLKPSSEYAGIIALTKQQVVRDVEMGVFKPDGEIAWISLTSAPIPLESYGIASVYVDITQRKQTEIALRQSEEQLRLITDSLPVCISYIDQEQRYRFVNKTYEKWFGCDRDEIYGKTLREFVGEVAYGAIQQYNERVLTGETVYYESEVPYRLGGKRYISATLVPNIDTQSQVRGWYALISDITERKQVEQALGESQERLQASLQEKEVLLAEIHHRVKNNLYVICSLLELQIDRLSDPQARAALEDSCNRVSSMALVHENLYQTHDFSGIDFADYVQQLTGDLLATYESCVSNIMLNVETNPVFLSLDQAIPCGLLLNELMTNALKHGFPEGRSGHIYIFLTCLADGWIELKVGNDGDRLPPDFDLEQNASMGLKLVMMFVEQLAGSLELERGERTWFKVRFPESNPGKRLKI